MRTPQALQKKVPSAVATGAGESLVGAPNSAAGQPVLGRFPRRPIRNPTITPIINDGKAIIETPNTSNDVDVVVDAVMVVVAVASDVLEVNSVTEIVKGCLLTEPLIVFCDVFTIPAKATRLYC